MKHILGFVVLSLFISVAHSATKCSLEIDDQTMMPQGPMETPVSVLQIAKEKGYRAKLVAYPRATIKGEFATSPKVTCLANVFNPFLVKCDTKVRVYNHLDEVVAEGTSSNNISFGAYSGDVVGAMKDLLNCKDL